VVFNGKLNNIYEEEQGMRKKNWLIGSIAAAAVVICGAVGINSVNAADADAKKSAKEEFVYEQLGRDDYTGLSGNGVQTWLTTSDNKSIALIDNDGTVYELDNSDGKYGDKNIYIASRGAMAGYLLAQNSEGKSALLKVDGSSVYTEQKYHDRIDEVVDGKNSYVSYVDDGKCVVYDNNGNALYNVSYNTGKGYILGSYLILKGNKTEDIAIFDKSGNDVSSKIQTEGYYATYFSSLVGDYLKVEYAENGKTWNSSKLIWKYYDADLNEVDLNKVFPKEGTQVKSLRTFDKNLYQVSYADGSYEYYNLSDRSKYVKQDGKSPTYDGWYRYDSELFANSRIFNTYLSQSESEALNLEDGYAADCQGVILGYKVYLGYKSDKVSTEGGSYYRRDHYALFDENGVKLLDNLTNDYFHISDKLVLSESNDEGDRVYKIVKVSLESESGVTDIVVDENNNAVADVTAKDVDIRDLEDENGNKLTVDDLDDDAKAVINQKFNFSIKAPENVIPKDSKISISKVVCGKEYNAAKQVVQSIVNRMAVFNIDLLNKDNVKVQPNGTLEITSDIPTGYNTAYLAVYRLSTDGKSYVKLNSKIVDGKIVFETDHFSTYMIVEEKPVVADKSDDDVETGDSSVMSIIMLVSLMSLAGLMLVTSFKKTRV